MSDSARAVQAVLGRKKPAQGVSPRDFRQPRRMGQARLRALRVALENLLPLLEKKLAETSGLAPGLGFEHALARLGEAEAETIVASAGETPCVLRFRSQKAPGWLVWDPAAAAGVLEALFGARGGIPAARRLSPSETRVASQILTEIVRALGAAAGIATSDFALVQVAAELGTWREAGPEAESYRFEVELELRLGEQTSPLRIYLPGVDCGAPEAAPALPEALPGHLEGVEVELSAQLRGCELTLDQLLALEAGDVIPLEARLGDSTELCVEGLSLARARLGSHRGRLAVRIERLSVEPEAAAA
jgi:flagellar motor switch protein FliM